MLLRIPYKREVPRFKAGLERGMNFQLGTGGTNLILWRICGGRKADIRKFDGKSGEHTVGDRGPITAYYGPRGQPLVPEVDPGVAMSILGYPRTAGKSVVSDWISCGNNSDRACGFEVYRGQLRGR